MLTQKFKKNEYHKLPHQPGVYKFLDKQETFIYVGKAKDLVKRVSSYFTKASVNNRKTLKLVREIEYIEIVLVNSEFDALLLENSLIKENQPKYNILLKDDKSFPSICITRKRFPRIFSTRRIIPSQGDYYGPYTSVKAMDSVLDLIRKLYKVRTCSFNLSQENIDKKKFKVCLEFHIGNCLGPCEGLQEENNYLEEINSAREILKGNLSLVKSSFTEKMKQASGELKFEVAHEYKIKLDRLEKFQSKSLIVNQKITNMDVLGVLSEEEKFYINYMKIEHGSIRISETMEAKKKIEEPDHEVLQIILFNLRTKFQSHSPEVLTNVTIPKWEEVEINIPKIGDKKKLVELSVKNAQFFKNDRLLKNTTTRKPSDVILEQLQKDLRLRSLPKRIECFDNSNIQGANPVASMVCFKEGRPSKSDYRRFNIKTVQGPDDFASMKEVISRRYFRVMNENTELPDLIIVDGGKGQLSSAVEALKEIGLYGKIPIIGIAKKLEEIYYPEDSIPLHINKKSQSLKLMQHLRDEAHRFAITFHRLKRSQKSTRSIMDHIKGIGPATKNALLTEFKSIKRIREASITELSSIIGLSKARIVHEFLQKEKEVR